MSKSRKNPPRCYSRIDIQTVCGHTERYGSHDRWNRGDRKEGAVQTPYSRQFQPIPESEVPH